MFQSAQVPIWGKGHSHVINCLIVKINFSFNSNHFEQTKALFGQVLIKHFYNKFLLQNFFLKVF